jgi:hypothetical protein
VLERLTELRGMATAAAGDTTGVWTDLLAESCDPHTVLALVRVAEAAHALRAAEREFDAMPRQDRALAAVQFVDRVHGLRAELDAALTDPNWCEPVPADAWTGEPDQNAIDYRKNEYGRSWVSEIAMLRRCLSEHHAAGVLDGVLVGDRCPVCAKYLEESNWCKR